MALQTPAPPHAGSAHPPIPLDILARMAPLVHPSGVPHGRGSRQQPAELPSGGGLLLQRHKDVRSSYFNKPLGAGMGGSPRADGRALCTHAGGATYAFGERRRTPSSSHISTPCFGTVRGLKHPDRSTNRHAGPGRAAPEGRKWARDNLSKSTNKGKRHYKLKSSQTSLSGSIKTSLLIEVEQILELEVDERPITERQQADHQRPNTTVG